MRAETTAEDLVVLVCAVPGVHGIDPGLSSTLRTLDARLRRDRSTPVHYGLVVDPSARTALVEVSLSGDRPVRGTVEAIQRAVRDALEATWLVTVRVQSILPPGGGERASSPPPHRRIRSIPGS